MKASIGYGQIKNKDIRHGLYEVIDQLEHMAREPEVILDELQKDLSTRDLQLVLVYFSQEGRDSWCVLEVFDWMQKVDRVDDETTDLMLSIMSNWLAKLVEEEDSVEEVRILLTEMKCVGLVLNYDMVEALISLYWDRGKRLEASRFVKYLLEFGGPLVEDEMNQDPTAYLMWKMSKGGEHREVVNLIFDLRNCGLKPKTDSYLTALMAVVMEQNRFSRAIHELKAFQRKGKVGELEKGEMEALDSYQRDLHKEGEQIAKWAIEENMPEIIGQIHEVLAAMYMVAVRSAKAEHHLWQMKLAGREPTTEMYDAVLAVCAVEKNLQAVGRLMAGMEVDGKIPSKKTFSWLVRGYVKGGHFEEAAKILMGMLKKGIHPDNLETVVVVKGMQKNHLKNGYTELYLNLCKSLYTAGLSGPCLIYLYIGELCIIRML